MASRIVGFVVKAFTILGYLAVTVAFVVVSFTSIIFWLAFPAVIIGLIYFGIKLLSGF